MRELFGNFLISSDFPLVFGRRDDGQIHRPAFRALADVLQRHAIGFAGKFLQILDILRVIDQLIVVTDVEPKLLFWARDGRLCQEGQEHKKHKRHKNQQSVFSCASCASCVPACLFAVCYHRKG